MRNNQNELNPEQMEQATGGYVVNDQAANQCWVVRQDGTVIGQAPGLEQAKEFAKGFSASDQVLTPEEYKNLFGRDLIW